MMCPTDVSRQLYRIWIASFQDWQPRDWQDVPPRAIALEAAEAEVLSASQARSFLEGFNSQILSAPKPLWAIAVPVTLHYVGDVAPGDAVTGHQF